MKGVVEIYGKLLALCSTITDYFCFVWSISVMSKVNNHLQNPNEALFSFQKISYGTRHIESSDTCMKH